VGTRIVLEQDLDLAPSLLIRLAPQTFSMLEGSTVTIADARRPADEQVVIATFATVPGAGSIMVGSPPKDWRQISLWEREIQALIDRDRARASAPQAAPSQGDATRNLTIVKWLHPHYVEIEGDSLRPGMTIRIDFRGPNGTVLASGTVALTREPFHDVLLE
ncbi:MAG: hypothetical protein KDA28_05035, partial [Phycisphaerales bacterium]|nr:hypothetical protein [Phycisphaerales bacterium]